MKSQSSDKTRQEFLPRPTRQEAKLAVRTLIAYIGDDPTRDGVLDTPGRVLDAYGELYRGYAEDPIDVLDKTFGDTTEYKDFILVKNIPFNSHCEHHMLPFRGMVHIAYLPHDRFVGLSKLARLVDVFALRLQSQENMTAQIAAAIEAAMRVRGVAILISAEHTCMTVRGIKKWGTSTTTSKFSGQFLEQPSLQTRFMNLVSAR